MAISIFTQPVIAVLWDFDQTLIPGYQQDLLFERCGIDSVKFWKEVNALAAYYEAKDISVSHDTLYLNHLLTYVSEGKTDPVLTNHYLREVGHDLEFYPGMPEFLKSSAAEIQEEAAYNANGIVVEHYVVSTGLRQMILGSAAAPYLKDVWACEFIEEAAGVGYLDEVQAPGDADDPGATAISQVGYFLDNLTKTRAVWEINKGCNVTSIKVNDMIADEDRRVPLQNMIYVADGPSDIPIFSILNNKGGYTLGVYNPKIDKHFEEVKSRLMDQGRVKAMAPADYSEGSMANKWIMSTLRSIATRIVADRAKLLADKVQPAAVHVTAAPKADG